MNREAEPHRSSKYFSVSITNDDDDEDREGARERELHYVDTVLILFITFYTLIEISIPNYSRKVIEDEWSFSVVGSLVSSIIHFLHHLSIVHELILPPLIESLMNYAKHRDWQQLLLSVDLLFLVQHLLTLPRSSF